MNLDCRVIFNILCDYKETNNFFSRGFNGLKLADSNPINPSIGFVVTIVIVPITVKLSQNSQNRENFLKIRENFRKFDRL